MRLEKIKLAGFKSFVDPTTVMLPGNLVGIVGPNGCGKSNVIDAVRWVMGESSAKMLRGESMSDVIFNGSNSRKPVGTAGIELVFDNADGSAGGEYAKYSQISVKRQVSRDGQSSYYMNGVRCRRRDITDLFLGTGLGPRSYSIIEQGMISRLIEARPEDLRAFLEEAAGISKYKERRRETLNRIGHTKENLNRINDLREEIAKQLQHLQRQAATAERYKEYKTQERRLTAELLALRWRAMNDEVTKKDRVILEQETDLEAAVARQRRLEAEIERGREQQTESNERFNQVQGEYYAVGSEIARLEQAIQYSRESRAQLEQDLRQTEQSWQESADHHQQDEKKIEQLNLTLNEEEPMLVQSRTLQQKTVDQLAESERQMQSWQQQWDEFNRKAAEPAQIAQVERTRINHLEQQDQNLAQRIERHQDELHRLTDTTLQGEISELAASEQSKQAQVAEIQERLSKATDAIGKLREQNLVQQKSLDEARARLQTAVGRQSSLEALQEAALGKQSDDGVTRWLETEGIAQAARLAEKISVNAGWETAVETVLGFHLQAVCVEGLDDIAQSIARLESGALSLLDTSAKHLDRSAAAGSHLIDQVDAPWPLDGLLGAVQCAESLNQALERRGSLRAGESLITQDGVWIGSNWLRLHRASEETAGVIKREQEIRSLARDIELLEQSVQELSTAVAQGRELLSGSEQTRDSEQRLFNEANRTLSDIRSSLSGKRTREEHLRNRSAHIATEIEELRQQVADGREELESARARLHATLGEMESFAERREQFIHERDELRNGLSSTRAEAEQQRADQHQLALRIESMRSARDSLVGNLQRTKGQLEQLQARRETLKLGIERGQEPLQEQTAGLELQLARRIEVEAQLSEARQNLEQIDARVRGLEQERNAAGSQVQQQHSSLEQSRMQRQEVVIRRRTLDEQLAESGFQLDQLLHELPDDAGSAQWEQEAERMEARIRRLGPINLAAIDEFQEQSERMTYLDAQYGDVTESLTTLENAIRKIDRETRTRFKETFDRVNSGLQDKFPQLFGGGHAYLQLTGEDLLDTGVTVMARPPGKRNSSIQLLSGGEKALTAVALVFAIFELNPAPFCMLDEVDAPLDDANVGRFCTMVKSMSERVQFIFITHNKITMEIANQLTGVTMHEPGVSRLVSVDIDQAAEMAAM